MPTRGVLLIIALALAAATVYWFTTRTSNPNNAVETRYQGPEFSARDFTINSTRPDGSQHYSMQGQLLTKWHEQPTTDVDALQLTYFSEEEQWRVWSDRAQLEDPNDVIQLQGNVRVQQHAADGVLRSTAAAERMTLYTQEDRIESDVPVTLSNDNAVLSGTGLSVDLNLAVMELHQQVRGSYVP